MKKVVFLAVLFAGMTAVSAQAQLFVGGSIGFDIGMSKGTSGTQINNGPSEISFDFSPKVGYFFSDKFGAGMLMSLGMGLHNDRRDDPTKRSSFSWGVGPFLRYSVLSRGDFSLLIEGGLGAYGESSKSTRGTTTHQNPSTFGFDISAMPLLSYNLTNRVSLEVSSNLLRFGFCVESEKEGAGESLRKGTNTSFGFGINGYDFFSSPYQIGVIFKF